MASGSGGVVAIFDFDRSLADADSDEHTMRSLMPHLAEASQAEYRSGASWPTVMDKALAQLQDRYSEQQIREAAVSLAFDPQMVEGIRAIAAAGAVIYIASDANSYYIEEILKHHGIHQHFKEIHTNRATREAGSGRIRITPYMNGHDCEQCRGSQNICKGHIVRKILSQHPPDTRVVYVGDGYNDFCGSLQLREADLVLARKDHTLQRMLLGKADFKAKWRAWADYAVLHRWLVEFVGGEVPAEELFD